MHWPVAPYSSDGSEVWVRLFICLSGCFSSRLSRHHMSVTPRECVFKHVFVTPGESGMAIRRAVNQRLCSAPLGVPSPSRWRIH